MQSFPVYLDVHYSNYVHRRHRSDYRVNKASRWPSHAAPRKVPLANTCRVFWQHSANIRGGRPLEFAAAGLLAHIDNLRQKSHPIGAY
jgi:hypothetical protein